MKFYKFMKVLLFFLLFSLIAGDLAAISVRPVSLADLVTLSDRVFLGRVVRTAETFDSRLNLKVTVYSFIVLEGIRGVSTGDTVEIRQAGSNGGGYSSVPGLPAYHKGQELLLFLHGNSRFGLTSPVGLAQGVFREVDLRDGGKGYVNGVDNRNLELESHPVDKTTSPVSAESVSTNYSGVQPLTIEMVRALVHERKAVN